MSQGKHLFPSFLTLYFQRRPSNVTTKKFLTKRSGWGGQMDFFQFFTLHGPPNMTVQHAAVILGDSMSARIVPCKQAYSLCIC
jgi:hypothetical protein